MHFTIVYQTAPLVVASGVNFPLPRISHAAVGTTLPSGSFLPIDASASSEALPDLIDISGAQDVTNVAGPLVKNKIDLSTFAVPKTEFLDIVAKLTAAGIDP